MWETSFVAVSVLLGDGVDDALAGLDPAAATRADALVQKLRDPRKLTRAQALAGVAQDVTQALAEVTLR